MKPQIQFNNRNLGIGMQRQSGFSLIELLVSSVIGIFLVGGVITNFIGSKETEKLRSASSEMDANARVAMKILRQNISHAGYPSINKIRLDKPFYTPIDGALTRPRCGNAMTIRVPERWQRTRDRTNLGDVLTMSYMADNPCLPGQVNCPTVINQNPQALMFTDCSGGGATRDNRTVACSTDTTGLGMPDPTQAKIYNTFWVRKVAGQRTLYCNGSRAGTQPLVDDIFHMEFQYGVTQEDGTTRYLRAAIVEDRQEWALVNSVQVGLLVQSSQKNILKKDNEKIRYMVLGRKIKITDKRRLYRVYTTTINLKNKSDRIIQ